MEKFEQYSIPFVGLKYGIHHFDYEIGDGFWNNFPNAPISKSEVSVHLTFDRKNNFFTLNFEMKGKVNVECDRCTDYFDLPIYSENKIVVKLVESEKTEESEDADIIFISKTETEFNVAQLVYELINLCIPMHKTHPDNEDGESTCNKKMLNELQKHLNSENKNEIDPRWAALKKISKN